MATPASRSNVEIAQRTYEDFNAGNLEAVLGAMADDIEWTEPEGDPFAGTYHGPAEIKEKVFEPALEKYEEFSVEADRFIDGGDTVVALGTFRVALETGKRIESPFAHVIELRDGRVARFENYTDTALWQ